MLLFLQNCLSYPTVIYSLFLVLVLIYWLISLLGVIDFEQSAVDGLSADSELPVSALSSILLKFRLDGLPLTITFTLFSLYGWLISYFAWYLLLSERASGIFSFLAGTFLFFTVAYCALLLTSLTFTPLRRWLKKTPAQEQNSANLLGRQVVVRSLRVTGHHGEALYEDGGAGLILKIRAPEEAGFTQGDQVVLIDYNPEENSYQVVSEHEFRG
ncbi:MAG: ubiquinone biosynthesis protein UbiH [Enterobacteriaceae bacterium]